MRARFARVCQPVSTREPHDAYVMIVLIEPQADRSALGNRLFADELSRANITIGQGKPRTLTLNERLLPTILLKARC